MPRYKQADPFRHPVLTGDDDVWPHGSANVTSSPSDLPARPIGAIAADLVAKAQEGRE